MKTLTISLALTFLLTGCAERKSDAYQTLQVEQDTLAPLAAQLEAEKAELEANLTHSSPELTTHPRLQRHFQTVSS